MIYSTKQENHLTNHTQQQTNQPIISKQEKPIDQSGAQEFFSQSQRQQPANHKTGTLDQSLATKQTTNRAKASRPQKCRIRLTLDPQSPISLLLDPRLASSHRPLQKPPLRVSVAGCLHIKSPVSSTALLSLVYSILKPLQACLAH